MAMQKFKMWMHKNMEGAIDGGNVWLAQCNLAGEKCFEDAISLGQVEFELDVPEIDTRAAALEALQAQIQKERADSEVRVNLLLERIGKLQCLAHEVAE